MEIYCKARVSYCNNYLGNSLFWHKEVIQADPCSARPSSSHSRGLLQWEASTLEDSKCWTARGILLCSVMLQAVGKIHCRYTAEIRDISSEFCRGYSLYFGWIWTRFWMQVSSSLHDTVSDMNSTWITFSLCCGFHICER